MSPALSAPDVLTRVGTTPQAVFAYVLDPDPQLERTSVGKRESLLADLPPLTAGAFMGVDGLARHLIASAATGRYRDLFLLWDLFRERPDACRPVLAERQHALERARTELTTALDLGLDGDAVRVAEDVTRAEGLVWQWVREIMTADLARVGRRPAVAAALLQREPDLDLPLPDEPDERWLGEAAAARQLGSLPEPVDSLLSSNADRLPATLASLALAEEHYPEQVGALVDRIDLAGEDAPALLAWAGERGLSERALARLSTTIAEAGRQHRALGLQLWHEWGERGLDVDLPDELAQPNLQGLELDRPETAQLIKALQERGAGLKAQEIIDGLAAENRQRAEKAYEAFVCAGLDVQLPSVLENNPLVRQGQRCPWCQAWTFVRAGHERRCPRQPTAPPEPSPTWRRVMEAATARGEILYAEPDPDAPEEAPAAPAASETGKVGTGVDAWDAAFAAAPPRPTATAEPETPAPEPDGEIGALPTDVPADDLVGPAPAATEPDAAPDEPDAHASDEAAAASVPATPTLTAEGTTPDESEPTDDHEPTAGHEPTEEAITAEATTEEEVPDEAPSIEAVPEAPAPPPEPPVTSSPPQRGHIEAEDPIPVRDELDSGEDPGRSVQATGGSDAQASEASNEGTTLPETAPDVEATSDGSGDVGEQTDQADRPDDDPGLAEAAESGPVDEPAATDEAPPADVAEEPASTAATSEADAALEEDGGAPEPVDEQPEPEDEQPADPAGA